MLGLVAAIAVVTGAGLVFGSSAAIVLATFFVVAAIVLTRNHAPTALDRNKLSGEISEETDHDHGEIWEEWSPDSYDDEEIDDLAEGDAEIEPEPASVPRA